MAKSYYLPSDDAGKDAWLANFAAKLASYNTVLGVTDVEVDSVADDAAFFHWCLAAQAQVSAYSQQWTAYKNAARSGNAPTLGTPPVAPNLGVAPAAVTPGIFGRATALAQRIKTQPGYTDAIGQALRIVGAEQTVDVSTLKPVFTAKLEAGQVTLGWMKQGMDGIEFWADRGDGKGFVFLAVDTVPDYTDTAALPAAGQSALWKYKAIYRQADDRVGQWSDVVSIAVAG